MFIVNGRNLRTFGAEFKDCSQLRFEFPEIKATAAPPIPPADSAPLDRPAVVELEVR